MVAVIIAMFWQIGIFYNCYDKWGDKAIWIVSF
jgi:hypothetical protein